MTPDEIALFLQLAGTLGPVGLIAFYVVWSMNAARKDGGRKDPVVDELQAIRNLIASLSERLAIVETILEERRK
jgi:hypothetical protein